MLALLDLHLPLLAISTALISRTILLNIELRSIPTFISVQVQCTALISLSKLLVHIELTCWTFVSNSCRHPIE